MNKFLKSYQTESSNFALFPTKLSDGKWIWLKMFKRLSEVREYEGFEEGVGTNTFRTYSTLKKYLK